MLSNSFQRIPKVSRRFRSTSVPDDDVILLLVVVRISHCPMYVIVRVYVRARRLCSGIQRVWTRHTDDFTSLWKWVIPFPTRRRPRRQECGIYRWSDRWNGVSRWRGTQKCGVISVISSRCTRGWFYGAICVRKPFWEAALAEETRGPFIPSNPSADRTTINVRSVMGQPVKIVRRTVTYRCVIPPINLHNFESLDFVGLLALELI